MRILIINSSDTQGGAARAAYRLHCALLTNGVESRMLVQDKSSDDFTVYPLITRRQKIIRQLRQSIGAQWVRLYKEKSKATFSPAFGGFGDLASCINEYKPDIVHLHWVTGGMLSIEEIAKLKAPVVWSLHDMWAFTGGCHYSSDCTNYLRECGACPALDSEKAWDLSRWVFRRKRKVFSDKDMTIVGLSRWLGGRAAESMLLRDKNHVVLPNPIDTGTYCPFDKEKARELWNLPKEKTLVLFGAMNATSDPRKGFDELREALHQLPDQTIELVVFGSSAPKEGQDLGFKTHYLGRLRDDVSMVALYGAVDLTVVPSKEENLSNTIMESLSCGTPVVGFDIGGNSDMIEHKRNGYLATAFDTSDFARGIAWSLDALNYAGLCTEAREKVIWEFDSNIVVKRYIELYKEILND